MAVVKYQCDTCKREVDIVRNIYGLETFGRCTITNGCKGSLRQQDVLQTYVNASIPPDVDGLDNWVARKILYKHQQSIESDVWVVEHNLGAYPSVQVHTTDVNGDYIEVTPLSVEIVSRNIVTITLSQSLTGIAQCIVVSTDTTEETTTPTTSTTFEQLSIGQQILIMPLTAGAFNLNQLSTVFLSKVDGSEIATIPMVDETPLATTYKALYKGKSYQYYVASIGTIGALSAVPDGSPFYFTNASGFDVFVLLTKAPHEDIALLKNNMMFPLENLSDEDQANTLATYRDGDIYVLDSTLEDIYPPFRFFAL